MLERTLTSKFIAGTNLTGEMASADWRFLLPKLELDKVVFIGIPSVRTLTVLASTCVECVVVSDDWKHLKELREECQKRNINNVSHVPLGGSSVLPFEDRSIDLIQVVDSNTTIFNRSASCGELARILKAEGLIYWEIEGLAHRFGSHRKLKMLTRQGFRMPEYFWITPFSGEIHAAVPLKNRKIASYFFSNVHYGRSSKKRVLSQVGGMLSRFGLHSYIAPRCAVLVRRSHSDEQSIKPPDYLVSLAKNAGIDLSGMSYGLSALGKANSNKIIFFVFEKSSDNPVTVVKMTRTPEFNHRLKNEYEVLCQLNKDNVVDRGTYPEMLFFGHHNNLAVLCLKAVQGKPFRTRTEGTPTCSIAREVAEWIVQLGKGSVNNTIASPNGVATALDQLFVRFTEIYDLSKDEKQFLAKKIDCFSGSSEKFPAVFQHGDPGTWNMMVSDQGKVVVLDWEAGEPHGMPLWDLFYYFGSYASWISRMQGSRDALKNFAQHFLEESPLGTFLEEITERYCNHVGLDKKLVESVYYTCWMHRALKEVTRLRASSVEYGHYVNLLRLVIEQRNTATLRRLFSYQ